MVKVQKGGQVHMKMLYKLLKKFWTKNFAYFPIKTTAQSSMLLGRPIAISLEVQGSNLVVDCFYSVNFSRIEERMQILEHQRYNHMDTASPTQGRHPPAYNKHQSYQHLPASIVVTNSSELSVHPTLVHAITVN